MVIPTRLITLPPFAELIHKDFYVPPVELEMEPGYGFLGMELDPARHSLHTPYPAERHSITTFRHHKHRAT